MALKFCSKCSQEKPLSGFGKDKSTKTGMTSHCKECRHAAFKKWAAAKDAEFHKRRYRQWLEANLERRAAYKLEYAAKYPMAASQANKKWLDANVEKNRQIRARYRRENPDKVIAATKAWRERNPDKVRSLAARRRSKLEYRITASVRGSIHDALTVGGKKQPTFLALGYDVEQLKSHLESLFLPGMSWENYGRGEGKWHIDHIVPLSVHNFQSTEDIDFKRAWALTNLQPLWQQDNLRKGAKLMVPFQPSMPIG